MTKYLGVDAELDREVRHRIKNLREGTVEWEDEYNDMYWVLIANHSSEKESIVHDDLFKNETTFKTPRLLPEYKDVDYLLKIETDKDLDINSIIKNIQSLPRIMAAYEISTEKLKSKNNLIF